MSRTKEEGDGEFLHCYFGRLVSRLCRVKNYPGSPPLQIEEGSARPLINKFDVKQR